MFDAAVIGAGPAGAVAAIALARHGYRVALFDAGPRVRARYDRLPPYAIEFLKHQELLSAAEQALVAMPPGSLTRWQDDEPRFTPGPHHILDRDCFDRSLVAIAQRSSVSVLTTRAHRPSFFGARWRIPSGSAQVDARFLIDASGRASNQRRQGAATAAICGVSTGVRLPDMRTEAAPNAWIWGAPVAANAAAVSVFLARKHCAGLTQATREALYRQTLQQTLLFRECANANLAGPLAVRDATPRAHPGPVAANCVTTGDACLALDPLLSHGLQIAFRLSTQAAAVCHTILSEAGPPDAAVEFFRTSQRATLAQHLAGAALLYSEHRTYSEEPFWLERSRIEPAPEPPPEVSPDAVYRLSALVRPEPVPALLPNGVIGRVEGFRHPSYGRPVAFLAGINAAAFLPALAAPATLAEFAKRCERLIPPTHAHKLLDGLVRNRVLIPAARVEQTVRDARVAAPAGGGQSGARSFQ
jgi:flavin-dependent dehydrogenase